jgi:hypothetical protein
MPCGAGLQAPAFEREQEARAAVGRLARCGFTTVAIAGGPGVDETRPSKAGAAGAIPA